MIHPVWSAFLFDPFLFDPHSILILSCLILRIGPWKSWRHIWQRSAFYKAYNKRFLPIKSLQELENCEQLRVSATGENWILELDPEAGILMLATNSELQALHLSERWVADGNFSYQPPAFTQLYTIHGLCRGESKAAIHILMPDRHHETYVRVLRVLRETLLVRFGSIGAVHGNLH